ncbi:unnamed protein product, partial [Discosporangium mesarthrocarpum]
DQFGVSLIAEHLGCPEADVMMCLASVKGISMSGTVAGPSRFHDDTSTYTGVHASGGEVSLRV